MERIDWYIVGLCIVTILWGGFVLFQKQQRTPCLECFESGYEAALDDMQTLVEPKVTRSRENY